MNRIGLSIALCIAAFAGVIFGVYPQLDIAIAAWFFDPATHTFLAWADWVAPVRDAATLLITLLVAPAVLAILGKLVMPGRRMLIPGRAAVFLSITLAFGPFFLANIVLKDHWARMRPTDIVRFGGADRFTPWWDPTGPCPDNCSFIAGEPSAAFWTAAPASLMPPQWRPLAYAAALAFGAAMGLLRMAGGAHFCSDVIFAGVLMFLVVWIFHGLIYRWRPTRLTDEAVERPLARMGKALAASAGRIVGRRSRTS